MTQTIADVPPAEPDAASVAPPRDVVIFVPGLGQSDLIRPAHIADLLCWELNQRAHSRAASFATTPTSVGARVVHRIERVEHGQEPEAVLDLYAFDPVAVLNDSKSPQNPLVRVLSLALTVVVAVGRVAALLLNVRRHGKSRLQVAQMLVVLLMVLSIVAYFGIAVFALVEATTTLVRGGPDSAVMQWPQWIVLVGAVLGGLIPNVREQINWLGERSVQMARYTWTGGLRNRLSGGLQTLVDEAWHRREVERIHLIGYSFGSLVALETVYPHNSHPPVSLRAVTSLTTIGSPFDLVRMVNTTYPQGRSISPDIAPRWLNIYQPIDVLGSNFRQYDDSAKRADEQNPLVGVTSPAGDQRCPDASLAWNPDMRMDAANFLMLRSVSVHTGYWDREKTAKSALGMVVETLYAGSPVLR